MHYQLKFYNNLRSVILFMFYGYLIVDSINGVLIREGIFSISVPYKLTLLVLVIIYIRKPLLTVGIVYILCAYFLIHLFSSNDLYKTAQGMVFLVRFFAIVLMYEFFKKSLRNNIDGEEKVLLFSRIAFFIIAINLILGLVGYGYAQYSSGESSIGSRGFIYAGNELAAAFIVSSAIVMMGYMSAIKFVRYLIFGLIFILLSVVSATKLTVLSSLLIFFFFPLISISRKLYLLKLPKKHFFFALIMLFAFPFVVYTALYLVLYEIGLMDRLAHFYGKLDFISFILSGRDLRAVELLSAYIDSGSLVEILFGKSTHVISEIDTVDMLIKYGAFGFFLVYGFFTYVIFKCLYIKNTSEYALYAVFMIFLLMGASTTAGHIVYSGVAGPLIAALLALGVCNRKVV